MRNVYVKSVAMGREVLEESRELRIVLCREQKNGPRVKSSVVAACGEHSPMYSLGAVLFTSTLRLQLVGQSLHTIFFGACIWHAQFALCIYSCGQFSYHCYVITISYTAAPALACALVVQQPDSSSEVTFSQKGCQRFLTEGADSRIVTRARLHASPLTLHLLLSLPLHAFIGKVPLAGISSGHEVDSLLCA